MPKSPDRRQQNERSAGERKVTGARRGRSTPSPGAGSRSPAPTAWLADAARGSRPPGPRQRPECRLRRSLAAGRPRGRRSSITGRDRTQRLRSSSRPGRWTGRPGGRPRSRRAGTPGERLGHGVDPSSEAAASQARSQPNPGQSQSVSTGTVGHLERCDGDHPRGSRPSSSRCDATSPTSTTGCVSGGEGGQYPIRPCERSHRWIRRSPFTKHWRERVSPFSACGSGSCSSPTAAGAPTPVGTDGARTSPCTSFCPAWRAWHRCSQPGPAV
jgi:hypothetical protein